MKYTYEKRTILCEKGVVSYKLYMMWKACEKCTDGVVVSSVSVSKPDNYLGIVCTTQHYYRSTTEFSVMLT